MLTKRTQQEQKKSPSLIMTSGFVANVVDKNVTQEEWAKLPASVVSISFPDASSVTNNVKYIPPTVRSVVFPENCDPRTIRIEFFPIHLHIYVGMQNIRYGLKTQSEFNLFQKPEKKPHEPRIVTKLSSRL